MKKTANEKATRKALRSANELAVVTKLGMKQRAIEGKLSPTDHKAIAVAARTTSQQLRKSDPEKASSLYYVFYKHTKLQGKVMTISRLSRKAKPVKVARKTSRKPASVPANAAPAEAVAS